MIPETLMSSKRLEKERRKTLPSDEREGMINSLVAFQWAPQVVLDRYDDKRIINEYDRMMQIK